MLVAVTTKDQILDCAQGLMQTCGYNGFSFRDIAGDIGIKSSSIHYHYPNKAELAVAVVSKYRADFKEIVDQLIADNDAMEGVLRSYATIFQDTVKKENRLCLCAMLASDLNSIEIEVRSEVKAFFADQHSFLTNVISTGQANGEFRHEIDASDFAKTYLTALEGAMILARVNESFADIVLMSNQMVSAIEG